jgi:hypothetical protein
MAFVRKLCILLVLLLQFNHAYCWGFFGHRKINYYAVFLLPPGMIRFYKSNIEFLREHATDPDKRRYAVAPEGPRHYIDLDHYSNTSPDSLPRRWDAAVAKFGADSLNQHGIVPWWVVVMLSRLTSAFREKDGMKILRLSAELGHYIADAHVPLHASSNHNGQKTGQTGIHGFWESRIPELLADREWDLFTGQAYYIKDPSAFIWKRVLESSEASDTVLLFEKELSRKFPADARFGFEERNGKLIRQYSSAYCLAYNRKLNGMIERRMKQSILAVACFWYTAWVNAGEPELPSAVNRSAEDAREESALEAAWKKGNIIGRKEEEEQ